MGMAGGVLAAAATGVLGAVGWATAQTAAVSTPALAAWSAALTFSLGAAGFVPALALLVAGVAVPGLLSGLLPRWLAVFGIAVAEVGMVSVLSALTSVLYPALPIGRFGGLLFVVGASATLPRRRSEVARSNTADPVREQR